MIKRILIVCVGNICRSPAAEALLRRHLDGRIEVASAGLAAVTGNGIDPLAASVLADHGLAADGHVARQINAELIANADIVLAMDRRQLSAILALAPQARGKAFLLGKWLGDAEIADPYGQPREAFERMYALIEKAVAEWRTRL